MTIEVLQQRRRWWAFVLGGVVFLAFGALATSYLMSQPVRDVSTPTQKTVPLKPPVMTKATSTVLFTGNVYWGRYTNQQARKSPLGTEFPFARLGEFKRSEYNAWIGGLECPTVPGVELTPAQEEATLSFNCSPEYLPNAAKWYTAFTLANNHTDNQGPEGFTTTQQQLDKHGIQYFGHYDPAVHRELCDVITIPAVATYDDDSTKQSNLPLALCGYHGVFKIPDEASLAVMEQYARYMPVIAMPHMGAEYKPAPDEIKTTTYHAMIDHGASMVIGDHPHWIQTTESYKGKLIVYSMGNFMFDQQFNSEVTRSAAIKVVFATDNNPKLLEWTKLAESCQAHQDDCLVKAESAGLPKLTAHYTFSAIGSSDKGYQTHPASALEQKAILERLKWSQTMQALGQR